MEQRVVASYLRKATGLKMSGSHEGSSESDLSSIAGPSIGLTRQKNEKKAEEIGYVLTATPKQQPNNSQQKTY